MGDNQSRSEARGGDQTDIVARLIQEAGRRQSPPEEARERALDAAMTAWRSKLRSRRQRRLVGWTAACVVLTAAAALLIGNLQGTLPPKVARMERIIGTVELRADDRADWAMLRDDARDLQSGSLVRTAPGSRAGIVLASGVSLRLADATEVAMDSSSSLRVIRGKVYLDTGGSNDPARRIQVITEAGTASDVGTQFEVRYQDGAYRLRVREGGVLLRQEGGEDINTVAGEQLTIDTQGGVQRTRIDSADSEWHWVESLAPAPDVDGQPVTVLLEWVARETGRSLKFAGTEVERKAQQTLLHGNIRHLAPLDALTVMLATTDLEHLILEDGTILIRTKGSR